MKKSEASNDFGLQAFARFGKPQRRSAAILAVWRRNDPTEFDLANIGGQMSKFSLRMDNCRAFGMLGMGTTSQ
jgi:hypothetical protein